MIEQYCIIIKWNLLIIKLSVYELKVLIKSWIRNYCWVLSWGLCSQLNNLYIIKMMLYLIWYFTAKGYEIAIILYNSLLPIITVQNPRRLMIDPIMIINPIDFKCKSVCVWKPKRLCVFREWEECIARMWVKVN